MPSIVPTSRPRLNEHDARQILASKNVVDPVALLGVRGYYEHTLGDPNANDRGIYDDAIFVISPTAFASFNANTDPSYAPSLERPTLATLMPGVWKYKRGLHGITTRPDPYPAFVQADRVTVKRDNGRLDTGFFGINIHRGGRNTTSSLGCQTIWPDQWDAFFELAKGEMIKHTRFIIPYCLIDEP
jgi:lysozyme